MIQSNIEPTSRFASPDPIDRFMIAGDAQGKKTYVLCTETLSLLRVSVDCAQEPSLKIALLAEMDMEGDSACQQDLLAAANHWLKENHAAFSNILNFRRSLLPVSETY